MIQASGEVFIPKAQGRMTPGLWDCHALAPVRWQQTAMAGWQGQRGHNRGHNSKTPSVCAVSHPSPVKQRSSVSQQLIYRKNMLKNTTAIARLNCFWHWGQETLLPLCLQILQPFLPWHPTQASTLGRTPSLQSNTLEKTSKPWRLFEEK